jgi:hypothetical protein
MIFEKFFHELIVAVGMETETNFLRGMETKTNFLRGMEVPDSERGMETVVFG